MAWASVASLGQLGEDAEVVCGFDDGRRPQPDEPLVQLVRGVDTQGVGLRCNGDPVVVDERGCGSSSRDEVRFKGVDRG